MSKIKIMFTVLTILVCIFISGCITGADTDGDGEIDDVSMDVSKEELVSSFYKTDSDGDGYTDEVDAFPNNAKYYSDKDGDGYADKVDAFPNNAKYYSDKDGDGYADEIDAFPTDRKYYSDKDGDGYADKVDDFPNDARYHSDYDKDGYADEIDEFKSDSKYHATCSNCDGTGTIYTDYGRYVEFTKSGNWKNNGLFNPDYFGYANVVNIDSHEGTFEVTAWFEDNGVNMWEGTQKFFIGSGSSHQFVFHYDANEDMDGFYYRVTPPTYVETVGSTCSKCTGYGKV